MRSLHSPRASTSALHWRIAGPRAFVRVARATALISILLPRAEGASGQAPVRRTRHALGVIVCVAVAMMCLPLSAAVAAPSHILKTTFGASGSSPANPYPLARPSDVEVDQSNGDTYVTNVSVNEVQEVVVDATGGTFKLTFEDPFTHVSKTTEPIAYNTIPENTYSTLAAAAGEVQSALINAGLSPNGVSVSPPNPYSGPANDYLVEFVGAFGGIPLASMTTDGSGLTGTSPSATVAVTAPGRPGDDVEKFNEAGEFLLMFGGGVSSNPVSPDVCTNTEACQPASSGSAPGQFVSPTYLAVDNTPGGGHDVYVADTGDSLVSKFDSSGQLITSWGIGGQKDGSDQSSGPFGSYGALCGVAVGPANGDLYVGGDNFYICPIFAYTQGGSPLGIYQRPHGEGAWLKVNSAGNVYVGVPFGFDPSTEEFYESTGSAINHYGADGTFLDTFGAGDLAGTGGIAVDGVSHSVYAVNPADSNVAVFGDLRPIVTIDPPTEITESGLTLNAEIEPAGHGEITSCYFEYGSDKSYGTTLPCSPAIPPSYSGSEPTKVTAAISGLSSGTQDHYRLVVTNSVGATRQTVDQTFLTTQPPTINALKAEELTATTAKLIARVNPNGLATTYKFEYGPSTNYGQVEPEPEGTLEASNSDQSIEVHLKDLTPGVVYHYILVATNADGTTTAEDHTFNFYPPSCPNENVRQQVQANYLPDCRAYELVSPENAAGTQLYPGGPNTGYATSPSRFSFTGLYSTVPNSGGHPIDGVGDLYVSTRTDTGWVTQYIGPSSDEVAIAGGPPLGPPVSAGVVGVGLTGVRGSDIGNSNLSSAFSTQEQIQNNVLTDPAMDTFVDWNDGSIEATGYRTTPETGASNAPYVWSADGHALERWPTNLATVPGGSYLGPGEVSVPTAAGTHALDCPTIYEGGRGDTNVCPGDVTASSDLSHFVFADEWNSFAPGGQVSPPGSVYDNDTTTGTVKVASVLQDGEPIPGRARRPGRRPAPDPRRLQRRLTHSHRRRRHRTVRV